MPEWRQGRIRSSAPCDMRTIKNAGPIGVFTGNDV